MNLKDAVASFSKSTKKLNGPSTNRFVRAMKILKVVSWNKGEMKDGTWISSMGKKDYYLRILWTILGARQPAQKDRCPYSQVQDTGRRLKCSWLLLPSPSFLKEKKGRERKRFKKMTQCEILKQLSVTLTKANTIFFFWWLYHPYNILMTIVSFSLVIEIFNFCDEDDYKNKKFHNTK